MVRNSRAYLGLLITAAALHGASAFTYQTFSATFGSRRALPNVSRFARALPKALRQNAARTLAVATETEARSLALDSVEANGKTTIIGGGPTGLTTAMMLAQKGWKDMYGLLMIYVVVCLALELRTELHCLVDIPLSSHVYDRLPEPPSPDDEAVWDDTARYYLIGLGGRGQKALKELGVWEEVDRYCNTVVGRMDWAPGAGPVEGVERIFEDRPYLTKVIARDRLVGVLDRIVRNKYSSQVVLHHGTACTDVKWLENDKVELTLQPTRASDSEIATGTAIKEQPSLVIGADGAARTVADCLEAAEKEKRGAFSWLPLSRRFKVKRYTDDNQRVYKTIPIKFPAGWRGDLNYSARTKDGRINIDALPASVCNRPSLYPKP